MGKIILFFWNCSDCLHNTSHALYPQGGDSEYLQNPHWKYPNYLILISTIGHQTVGWQMKLDPVIVQIKTIEVYFQIPFSIF